jgi:hypothetical protein
MLGLLVGIAKEKFTGQTLMEQIGFDHEAQIRLAVALFTLTATFATSNLFANMDGKDD